jgi:uncharacterized protein (TIGR03382 family)
MFGRAGLKFMALVFLGLAVFASPASAVTVEIVEGNTYDLVPGNKYQGGGNSPGAFHFKVDSLPGYPWMGISVVAGGVPDAAEGLNITWLLDNVPIAGFINLSVADFQQVFLPLTLTGIYTLVINAVTDGTYTVSLTTTPLPPALILFGTALAGLGWLGRRRRASAAGA